MSIHQLDAAGDPHRPRSSWHHLIDAAGFEADVLARLREFFSTFTPHEIDALPQQLRPRKLMGPRDVTDYAYELVTFQLENLDAPAVLHAFTDVVSHASSRLSSLSAQPPRSDQEIA